MRPNGSTGAYTILSPRHEITSAPYNVRSWSSVQADSVAVDLVR